MTRLPDSNPDAGKKPAFERPRLYDKVNIPLKTLDKMIIIMLILLLLLIAGGIAFSK